jgi:hypothetical protein
MDLVVERLRITTQPESKQPVPRLGFKPSTSQIHVYSFMATQSCSVAAENCIVACFANAGTLEARSIESSTQQKEN